MDMDAVFYLCIDLASGRIVDARRTTSAWVDAAHCAADEELHEALARGEEPPPFEMWFLASECRVVHPSAVPLTMEELAAQATARAEWDRFSSALAGS